MRKSCFSEEQIIEMMKEQEAGLPTVEVCRKQARRAFLHNGGVTPGALVSVNEPEYQTGRISL